MNWKLIGAGLLAGGVFPLQAVAEDAGDNRPNILFILSDDHTSQTWGVYGGILSEYAQTENIRRIAAEGPYWTIVFVRIPFLRRAVRRF